MKPGDLVRLTIDPFQRPKVVHVASIPPGDQWAFDDGTTALIIDEYLDAAICINDRKLKILVEGRVGWVFESECEVINEVG